MKKQVTLKNGEKIFIRFLRDDDLEAYFAFFQSLSREDKLYLRRNVANRAVVRQLILEMKQKKVKRLVALYNDHIVAEGTLEFEEHDWKGHIGELRLIVSSSFQRKGLGMVMARELYMLALHDRLEEIVVKMMKPQIAAQKIFKRLGFHDDVLFAKYVKDMKGERQDLVVMRCNLNEMWSRLGDYFQDTDWERRK